MKHRLLTTAALFGPAAALLAPAIALAQPQPRFDPALLSRHVQILSSDAYEGRGPATRGETKTVDYLVAQFRSAGLQPGGEIVDGKRAWTQRVPLLKSDIVGAPQLGLKLGSRVVPLTQGNEIAVRAPMNGATRVNLSDAPLVFVGYGTSAPERGWDDYKNVDVRGKLLVMLVNDPDFEAKGDPLEGDFGGKAMTYYGRWTYKYEEAAKRGAAGVLLIHETAPASYGWATVKNSNTNTMFDIVRATPAASHTAMESWIQRDLAERIFAHSGTTLEAAKAAARRSDFVPVPLKATLNANYAANTSTITSYNVAGVVPGKSRPSETVIFTAHHDHLGIGQPDANGDRIYNGAIDNGTGIAQLIEQGRAFAKGPRPERSVVFLAVGAEEKGLLGSEYYVANPIYPLASTVGVINTDGGNVFGPVRDFSISGSAKLDLLDMLIAEGSRAGRRFVPEEKVEAGYFFRSDHFPFAKQGVPAISFRRGNDFVQGGTARGIALQDDYTAKRYHQPDDEYEAGWDFSGMVDDSLLLHRLGQSLANGMSWPNWSQDSEFRGVRDRTQSAREPGGALPPAAPQPAEGGAMSGERG